MTALLLRLFVRDYQNTDAPKTREAYGRLAGLVGIVCNLLLFAGKLLVGTLSGSVSITADAVNNLSDASGSIVTLLGFKLAAKPADDKHPYGHSRYEYFSGLVVAALILIIGAELALSSFRKILHPEPVEFSILIVIVLAVSVGVKLWMALFNAKLGKRIHSAALAATAADSRNDAISTAAVLLGCLIGHFTGLRVDGYIGFGVALLILWSGIGIARDTINPLLGEAPDEELVHHLAHEITRHEKILGIHDLIVHDYGPGRRFASVHAEMDYRLDPLAAHECIDDIEREVKQNMNIDLVIHYDPIVTDDPELDTIRHRLTATLAALDPRLTLHDFRMVRGNGHSNVIFDVVVPHDAAISRAEIQQHIDAVLQTGAKKYYAIVTFDDEAFNDPHTRTGEQR